VAESFVLAWSSMPTELPEKISASQLRALTAIRRAEAITVSDLAQTLSALPSSATRLCDRLIAAGYIERGPHPTNRRFHVVALTGNGHRLLEALDRHREQTLAAVMAGMPAEGVVWLRRGLASFADHTDRLPAPASRFSRSSRLGPLRPTRPESDGHAEEDDRKHDDGEDDALSAVIGASPTGRQAGARVDYG
jgi:DNA-binding MarR family transcriptional regulator